MTLELGQREKETSREEEREEKVGVVVGLPGHARYTSPYSVGRLADWQTFPGSFLGEIRDKERDRATLLATFKTF